MKAGDRGWFPSAVTLRERWMEVVRLHPDRIAVRVGDETVTYAAMATEVDRWVRALEGCLGREARGAGTTTRWRPPSRCRGSKQSWRRFWRRAKR